MRQSFRAKRSRLLSPRYRAEPLEQRCLLAAINSGQTLLGSFTGAGQTLDYTISANANDVIVFGATETVSGSPLSLRVQLLSPSLTILSNLTGAAGAGTLVSGLAASGTYTVRVLNTAGTGDFNVSVAKVPGAHTLPAGEGTIVSGAYVSGTITPGDIDIYSMTLNANASVTGVITEISAALDMALAVIGPNGQVLYNTSGTVGHAFSQALVPATGVYTFVAWDNNFDATGDYRFTAVGAVATQVVDADSVALTSGVRRTGTIDLGDADVYTIAAPANGNIVISAAKTGGGANFATNLQVFSPTGARLNNTAGAVGQAYVVTPTVGGTYTIVVFDQFADDTAPYALTATVTPGTQPTDADSGPINSGDFRTGTIDPGDVDVYTFNATVNGAIVLRVADTVLDGFDPAIILTNPSGTVLFNSWDANIVGTNPITLAATGTYSVMVYDQGGDESGTYALSMITAPGTLISDADSGPITSGVQRTGSLPRGDMDAYTITLPAGGNLVTTIGEINTPGVNFEPWLQVYSPTGARVANVSGAVGTGTVLTATTGGIYTIVVFEAQGDDVGDYAITAVAAPGSQPTDADSGPITTSGDYRTGTIGLGDVDVYTISANASGSLLINLADLNVDGFDPGILVTNAAGTVLVNTWDANAVVSLSQTLAVTGTYTIIIYDQGADEVGSYGLTVVAAPAPSQVVDADSGTLASGVTRTGSLSLGDIDVYTINVPTGSSLLSLVAEDATTAANVQFTLFNPAGAVLRNVAATVGTDWLQSNVTIGGTYVLCVFEQSGDQTMNYRVSAVLGNGAQPSDGESGPVTPYVYRFAEVDHPADVDVYTINVNAGDQLLVEVSESEYLGASATGEIYLTIYGPTGAVISNGNNAIGNIVLTAAAAAAGQYTISVHDGGADETNVYGITIGALQNAAPAAGGDLSLAPDGGPITSGQTLRGRLDSGDLDVYTFVATNAQNLVYSVSDIDNTSMSPGYILVAPNGTLITNTAGIGGVLSSTTTLPATGTYKLIIYDQFGEDSGEYAVSIALSTGAQPTTGDSGTLVSGTPRTGAISIGDLDVYTYNATTTANIAFAMAEPSANGFDPRIIIFRPDGTRFTDTTSLAFNITGVTVGTWTFVVCDNAADEVGTYSIALNAAAGADTTPPTFIEAAYRYDTVVPNITLFADEDLGFTLQLSSFVLRNLTTSTDVPSAQLSLTYDSVTSRAVISPTGLPGAILPDGSYRLTMLAGGVSDGSGNALAANYVYNFHVLKGDFNRDHTVGFDDLLVVAQNYGKIGRPFSRGNAEYDTSGTVNFDDLLVLSQNYGKTFAVEAPTLFSSTPIRRKANVAQDVVG